MTTQATPRQLSKAELHRELRLADQVIEHAIGCMSTDSRMKLVHDLCLMSITEPCDPYGCDSREQALNRIHPLFDPMPVLRLVAVILSLFVVVVFVLSLLMTCCQ